MSNIKSVAVKFNLEKESDNKFYSKLMELDNGVYVYPAQYAKVIICKYLQDKMSDEEADIYTEDEEEKNYTDVLGI